MVLEPGSLWLISSLKLSTCPSLLKIEHQSCILSFYKCIFWCPSCTGPILSLDFRLILKGYWSLFTARLNLILVSGVSGVFWHHGVHFWVLAASLLASCSSKWLYKVEASLWLESKAMSVHSLPASTFWELAANSHLVKSLFFSARQGLKGLKPKIHHPPCLRPLLVLPRQLQRPVQNCSEA